MGRLKFMITCFLMGVSLIFSNAYAQNTLNEIADNIEKYSGKVVHMELKLKYHDPIFNVLTFYDSNNTDITFDIKELQEDKAFRKQMLNLYRGREYTVTFEVQKKGNLGFVMGKLVEVKPSFLEKIPEAEENIK